ncbi:MAG: Gfo/Idh/MocA family oxidoreductase [Sedimentisphaerales bacterium]|nr:Gfo/Idh/MocA family oxidoreductase [Sedimentisphaerales bacterium]
MQNEKDAGTNRRISRRDFLGGSAAAAMAFTIVPSHVLGANGNTAPSGKLNVAGVGVGGMGKNNVRACNSENIVALCDVDEAYAGSVFNEYPKAKKYTDFRKMLEQQKEIDAVIVATPDHTHAVVAMTAMQMGKHVYVQKPMTHNVWEARMLTKAARKYKVATQMGNQGHSGEGCRLIYEWINAGVIGEVREVHAFTNRPIWPQGIDRPQDTPPVPETLDWDLWLGPAPMRPYNPAYLPFRWRGWWDYGTGALGDMGCHVLDPVFFALKLKYPERVIASSTPVNDETAPLASIVRFEYPAREGMPPVKIDWYDGKLLPPRPEELEPGRRMGNGSSGVIFIGSKGKIMCGEYGDSPRLLPESRMREFSRNMPDKTVPRIDGSHEQDWIQACKGGRPACSNFDYSGPLTEMIVMGNLAIRTENKNEKLEWDGENMKVTNIKDANKFVRREYRKGWSLEEL